MNEIHFFDVDNTITAKSTSVQYLILGVLKGIFPPWPLFSVPGLMLKYRVGNLSIDHLYRDGIPFLKGINRDKLEILAERNFHKRLKKQIFRDAYNLIKTLQQEGKKVVLATSSIDIVVAPLMEFLGIKTFIASSLFFENAVCTGMFAGIPAFGAEKLNRVRDYIKAHNTVPADCYFYSDSIHDLPLLKEVGHPVAVNPDKLLYEEAVKAGWPVLSFTGKGTAEPVA